MSAFVGKADISDACSNDCLCLSGQLLSGMESQAH